MQFYVKIELTCMYHLYHCKNKIYWFLYFSFSRTVPFAFKSTSIKCSANTWNYFNFLQIIHMYLSITSRNQFVSVQRADTMFGFDFHTNSTPKYYMNISNEMKKLFTYACRYQNTKLDFSRNLGFLRVPISTQLFKVLVSK